MSDALLRCLLVCFLTSPLSCLYFFFFNDTATTEIYTLSLHDALPIYRRPKGEAFRETASRRRSAPPRDAVVGEDRKSTRLNSSHGYISYAVFCLKKKKQHSATRERVPHPRKSWTATPRHHTPERRQAC